MKDYGIDFRLVKTYREDIAMKTILEFLRDEDGLTMIEYAIAGGVIALGAAAAFGTLNTSISGKVGEMAGAVDSAGS